MLCLLLVLIPGTLAADTSISLEPVPCLEVERNRVVRARVAGDLPGSSVRLYFRRLNHLVEDFYWLEMEPAGSGEYWAVLPKPEDRELERYRLRQQREEVEEYRRRLQAEGEAEDVEAYSRALWWRVKELSSDRNPNFDLDQERIEERAARGREETRHWLATLDDREFEQWLAGLVNEPAELFVTVYDPEGRRLAVSDMVVVEVMRRGCELPPMDEREEGYAQNLVVGETAPWQIGEEVFHWQCDGVVTRIDHRGIRRADDRCRACVIAWWQTQSFLIPTAATLVGTGTILINEDEPRESSPSRPLPPIPPRP